MSGRFIRLAGDRSAYATSQSRSYAGADWDDDDNQYWQEMPEKEPDQPEGALKTNVPAALAMALTAGRWWLLRGRSPLSAAGLGLAVGGALLAGGPIAHTLLGIVWAAHRLMAVSDALGDSACSVDRD
jgi:hypothetical protein